MLGGVDIEMNDNWHILHVTIHIAANKLHVLQSVVPQLVASSLKLQLFYLKHHKYMQLTKHVL